MTAKTCTVYQFPKRSRRTRPVDDDGQVLRRHRVLAEVPGFMRALAAAMRANPNVPRAAWVAAARSPAAGVTAVTVLVVAGRAGDAARRGVA